MPGYFEFEVSMQEIKPKVWRRFLLRDLATFLQLHEAIQASAGWWNYHLFEFRNPALGDDNQIAGIPSDEDIDLYGSPLPDASMVDISAYFGMNKYKSCEYAYDFGDGWVCDVKLIQEVEEAGKFKRKLLGGERAFPHEDSGGIMGYERFVKVVKKKKDPYGENVKHLLKWLGGWHPDKFDYETTKVFFDKNKYVPMPGE